MKLFTPVLFAVLCAPATLFAQKLSKETTATKAPKLVIGANVGLVQSHDNYYGISKTTPTAALFARYYMGNHLALESGVKFSTYGQRTIQSVSFQDHRRVTVNTVSVPLHLQYHILSSESKVRPYFGLGAGMTRKFHNTIILENWQEGHEFSEAYNDPFFQFTQGLTWQLTKDLQLNQSVYYQNDRVGNFGFDIGLGYTIR
jgi:outer membrane protein W